MAELEHSVVEIERCWLKAGVPSEAVFEMSAELRRHLFDAETDERSVEEAAADEIEERLPTGQGSVRDRNRSGHNHRLGRRTRR